MADVTLKIGDTLLANCVYSDAAGDPVDLRTAGITITSSVRSEDGLTTWPLTVTVADQDDTLGGFTVSGDTSEWTEGRCLAWDIRYQQAGRSSSTRTVSLALYSAVTPVAAT